MTTLADLKVGMEGYIEQVQCKEIPLRKHILDMGLTPGAVYGSQETRFNLSNT